jgi:hypothetical protein
VSLRFIKKRFRPSEKGFGQQPVKEYFKAIFRTILISFRVLERRLCYCGKHIAEMTAWPIPEKRRAEDRTRSSCGDQDFTMHSTEARLDRT